MSQSSRTPKDFERIHASIAASLTDAAVSIMNLAGGCCSRSMEDMYGPVDALVKSTTDFMKAHVGISGNPSYLFGAALAHMRDGFTSRRSWWPDGQYMGHVDIPGWPQFSFLFMRRHDGVLSVVRQLPDHDVLACDWKPMLLRTADALKDNEREFLLDQVIPKAAR